MERIGDYRVEREIRRDRRDELGTTYQAVHLVLPRVAAIRVLAANQKPLAIQLFREACILEALCHPGAPRVFECGVLADGDHKRPWVAMELVDGPTIDELCHDGPLAIADLVVAIRTIAEVLEHAHARGVIHQRLEGGVVVRTPARHAPFTVLGWGGVGTQDSSAGVHPARDVHALGVLAFRALTGTEHVPGASARANAPAAPTELAALIDDMLASVARPTAGDIRERATWLAGTVEPKRSTQEMRPLEILDPPSAAFSIRIHRG